MHIIRQNFVWVKNAVRVKQVLDLLHGRDGLGALRKVHKVAFLETHA